MVFLWLLFWNKLPRLNTPKRVADLFMSVRWKLLVLINLSFCNIYNSQQHRTISWKGGWYHSGGIYSLVIALTPNTHTRYAAYNLFYTQISCSVMPYVCCGNVNVFVQRFDCSWESICAIVARIFQRLFTGYIFYTSRWRQVSLWVSYFNSTHSHPKASPLTMLQYLTF